MSRWFRVYAELIDDPKFIKLGPDLRSALLMTWCVAAGNNGILPPLDDIALKFRLSEARTKKLMDELRRSGFIDDTDKGPTPHNWAGRQFQSDTSTNRVKRFRDKKRNDVETFQGRYMKRDSAVTVTAPDTDTDTEQKQKDAADAAPVSEDKQVYDLGKKILGSNSGGLIKKLITAKNGILPLAHAALLTAQTKSDPREFIGAIIRNRDGIDDLRARGEAW